jgi:hypothetical protein
MHNVLLNIACFCSAMLGVKLAYMLTVALDRSRRAYVKALEALIEALKEENNIQRNLIRQMNDRAYFQTKQKSSQKMAN